LLVAEPCSLYRYFDEHGTLIYVGITSRRTKRQKEHNTDKDWWQYVHHQTVQHFDTREEAEAKERAVIRHQNPPFNTAGNRHRSKTYAHYMGLREAGEATYSVHHRKQRTMVIPRTPETEEMYRDWRRRQHIETAHTRAIREDRERAARHPV
jgi:predicted GIY-YIG superfamily endonuclease